MKTKHYSSEHWADYIRRTAAKNLRAEMKRHLDSGCVKCVQTLDMWTAVSTLAQQEPGSEPPESAVRIAKSYFALGGGKGKESLVPRVARLIFDSSREPQLAGVRSTAMAPRHYVYQSRSMLVDVWIEPVSGSSPLTLTGQILEKSASSQALQNVVVKLRIGETDVAATKTNEFGEFHLEIQPATASNMALTIGNENRIAVLISIGPMAAGQAGNTK